MIRLPENQKRMLLELASRHEQLTRGVDKKSRREGWKALDERKGARPMIFVNELPWHEMPQECQPVCTTEPFRSWETELRKEIYITEHLPFDHIPKVGLEVKKVYSGGSMRLPVVEKTLQEAQDAVSSHEYSSQVSSPEDLDRLIDLAKPVYDLEKSEYHLDLAKGLFGDTIDVYQTGVRHIWYTPWDYLIQVWGVSQALLDLVLNPELVSYALERYSTQAMGLLDAFESQGLLHDGAGNTRVGSGGYGYCELLPDDEGRERVGTSSMWGCSNAQIFSGVSEQMHWDFALKYDIPWLSRWGKCYYGCCEPLDIKSGILKRIPNLAKVSVSPWADLEKISDALNNSIVYSCKPNPAIFATDIFDEDEARRQISSILDVAHARELSIELVMKDVSTLSREPQRLIQWISIAREEIDMRWG